MRKVQKTVSSRAYMAFDDDVIDQEAINAYRAKMIAKQDPVPLYEERRYESDLKNQAWVFIIDSGMWVAFEKYRTKQPVSRIKLKKS